MNFIRKIVQSHSEEEIELYNELKKFLIFLHETLRSTEKHLHTDLFSY